MKKSQLRRRGDEGVLTYPKSPLLTLWRDSTRYHMGEAESWLVPKVLLQGHTLFKERCCSFAKQLLVPHKAWQSFEAEHHQSRGRVAGTGVTSPLPGAPSLPAGCSALNRTHTALESTDRCVKRQSPSPAPRHSLSEIDTFPSGHKRGGRCVVVEVLQGQQKEFGLLSRLVEAICSCSLTPMGDGSRA